MKTLIALIALSFCFGCNNNLKGQFLTLQADGVFYFTCSPYSLGGDSIEFIEAITNRTIRLTKVKKLEITSIPPGVAEFDELRRNCKSQYSLVSVLERDKVQAVPTIYPRDLLNEPTFNKIYRKLLNDRYDEDWIINLNGVGSPVIKVKFKDTTYVKFVICKPDHCAANSIRGFYSEKAQIIFALLKRGKDEFATLLAEPEAGNWTEIMNAFFVPKPKYELVN
jgi:hypothetical protein